MTAKLDEVVAGSIAPSPDDLKKVIEKKIAEFGAEKFYMVARAIMLQTIDTFWVEHLEVMDYMRSSVNLRAYGQRDPLVEYKKEGLKMFKEMEMVFKDQLLSMVETINVENAVKSENAEDEGTNSTLILSHNEPSEFSDVKNVAGKNDLDIGRNDPCPCGAINPTTGEVYKWKKCGMINAPQHRKALIS